MACVWSELLGGQGSYVLHVNGKVPCIWRVSEYREGRGGS